MLSDIAGDVKRCIDAKLKFDSGEASKDYSEFWLNRVVEECRKNIPERELPEFEDEIESIRGFLKGEYDSEYILRYWKVYEYGRNPYESVV